MSNRKCSENFELRWRNIDDSYSHILKSDQSDQLLVLVWILNNNLVPAVRDKSQSIGVVGTEWDVLVSPLIEISHFIKKQYFISAQHARILRLLTSTLKICFLVSGFRSSWITSFSTDLMGLVSQLTNIDEKDEYSDVSLDEHIAIWKGNFLTLHILESHNYDGARSEMVKMNDGKSWKLVIFDNEIPETLTGPL